ncbi:MAG: cysteine desulfurase [Armatimonadetes bacterium]|nr:cysteine desulfurase [Armatimonadota bacterium]
MLDIAQIRAQFPILDLEVRGKPLVYLDNAATTQKPRAVLERIQKYYECENANIHRAVHFLSEVATRRTEEARVRVARFMGARDSHEVIFTRGCTEGINLVAGSWGRANIGAGDEIILTEMEHHSNIVPWQILAAEKGAVIKVAPINDDGELILDEFEALFSSRTKIVSVVHLSNSLGTINPAKKLVEIAHGHGALILLDGAQSVSHIPVDVQDLGCDFFVFSGHKIYGPTGIGALWARRELLEAMPPYQGGGDMISSVRWSGSTWNELPYKFEAGTPNMEGAIGLAAALEWVEGVGLDNIAAHEAHLLQMATDAVKDIPDLTLIGRAQEKASVLSFVLKGAHPNDIGTLLDARGVAIRTGHHCTQPLMERFGLPATARASFAVYNTEEEVEKFVEALHFAREMLV